MIVYMIIAVLACIWSFEIEYKGKTRLCKCMLISTLFGLSWPLVLFVLLFYLVKYIFDECDKRRGIKK